MHLTMIQILASDGLPSTPDGLLEFLGDRRAIHLGLTVVAGVTVGSFRRTVPLLVVRL